jgi:hypothetical protein
VHPKGVFKITNIANGKILIGGTPNLDSKWNSIKMQLQLGSYINKELQKEWNEFGEENFRYEIVDTLKLKDTDDPNKKYTDEIKELEQMYLDELQPFGDKGYNKSSKH